MMYDRIGKWKIIWRFTRLPEYGTLGWYRGSIGLIKILQKPPEGVSLSRKYYRGYVKTFKFWLPFDTKGY